MYKFILQHKNIYLLCCGRASIYCYKSITIIGLPSRILAIFFKRITLWVYLITISPTIRAMPMTEYYCFICLVKPKSSILKWIAPSRILPLYFIACSPFWIKYIKSVLCIPRLTSRRTGEKDPSGTADGLLIVCLREQGRSSRLCGRDCSATAVSQSASRL